MDYPNFSFEVTAKAKTSRARLGKIYTPHGVIETPNFIFCGTKAAIKGGLTPRDMQEANTQIILSNTYHLMIQPGGDLIEQMGGLHKFMGWDGPMLTDSGGYQVFAMGQGSVADEIKGRNSGSGKQKSLLKITEEHAEFRSYKDGSILTLGPESSMHIQRQLGADIIMQMDECSPYNVPKEYTEASMRRNFRWADRCITSFERSHDGTQSMYGIVCGGVYEEFRKESCDFINDRDFFGTAIGDCLGGKYEEFHQIVSLCTPRLREDRPIHLLGIGHIKDIFDCVVHGIDTFDCVHPTRIARHGTALMKGVPKGEINLRNAKYREDKEPLDDRLPGDASSEYSKSYIHHLLKAGETLGGRLVAQHNVAVMNQLMQEVREAIENDTLESLREEWLPS